jgi:hypothetical protein
MLKVSVSGINADVKSDASAVLKEPRRLRTNARNAESGIRNV